MGVSLMVMFLISSTRCFSDRFHVLDYRRARVRFHPARYAAAVNGPWPTAVQAQNPKVQVRPRLVLRVSVPRAI